MAVAGSGLRVDSILAEANLLRLRSQWTEAEKRCVDVMRYDCNNVHAHMLLGDIYRDQGKIEDARQWYQMGLDLDPDHPGLNEKLRETRGKSSRRLAQAPRDNGASKSPVLGTQNLLGLSPTNWFRVIWIACILFIVTVAGLALWVRSHPRMVAFIPTGTLPTVPALVQDPGRGADNTVVQPPASMVTGTLTPSPSSATMSPAPNPTSTKPASGATPTPASSDLVAVTAREEELNRQLSRPGVLPQDMALGQVSVDARGQRVKIVLIQRAALGAAEADIRTAALRSGLVAAQAAFATDPGYSSADVETRLAVGEGQPQAFFEGSIDRASAQRADPSFRDEYPFTNISWATGHATAAGEAPSP